MSANPADITLPSIARLSPELIHHIASISTCSSALNLRLTCRAFHHICDSQLLFKEVIHNGNGLPVPRSSSSKWAYSELVLSPQQPARVWARYALADMKARELSIIPTRGVLPTGFKIFETSEQVPPRRFESWMPQLCALHHPEVEIGTIVPTMTIALMAPVRASSFSAEQIALSFVFTCHLLSDIVTRPCTENVPSMRLKNDIFGTHWRRPNEERELARLVVGFMAFDIHLHRGFPWWQMSGQGPPTITQISPPTFKQIPFADLMTNIPLPFEPGAAELFNVCHLERMASKAFLEAGEWVGFYCSPMRANRLLFDPPMHGIFFHAEEEREAGWVYLQSDGVDGVGAFTLEGTLQTATGEVAMTKQYLGAHRWEWQGCLTPFGLVGIWGGVNAWFWLWKADWCR